uniref:Calmodulin-binding transcription activator 3 n=1 Tax=Anthurium amnicola TaxID=1678845 RepID=A0A1D1ZLF8_9ARAE
MAATRRYGITPQLDIEQILLEAQHRWLRPAEICEILRNYRKFRIAPEPPNRPPSGSLFLFDRKVLRYFRKDGHNWRKKKDGKTVKEAHERLKVGSIDVLHCYYAHGEENENFQRRSYWLLEEDFMHIVLVHYREVQGNKSSFGRGSDNSEHSQSGCMETPVSSNSFSNHNQLPSQTTGAESPNSAHTSEYEDAESDNYQASSRYHPHVEFQQSENGPMMNVNLLNPYFPVPSSDSQGYYPGSASGTNYYSVAQEDITKVFNETGLGLTFSGPRTQVDLTSWDEVLEHCATKFPGVPFPGSVSSVQSTQALGNTDSEPSTLGEIFRDVYTQQAEENFQITYAEDGSVLPLNMDVQSAPSKGASAKYSSLLKQLSLDITNGEEDGGLKKYDSFSRWMSKELGEVDETHMQSNSAHYWNTVESESVVEDSVIPHNEDMYLLSPSLAQDQLFSIIDFSPNWAYAGLETKVLVTGTFLKDKIDLDQCKWSCMFGEVEVPAEVLVDGILRCRAPPHKAGRVPFYVTCSNRLACSEIREFEYRVSHPQYMEISDSYRGSTNDLFLHIRLEKLLSIDLDDYQKPVSSKSSEKLHLSNKVSSLLGENDDDWSLVLNLTSKKEFSPDHARNQLLEKLLKQKLHAWLLHKIAEDGKGPSVLDKEGQGVLHFAAALGYDWAIAPTIAAGVSIDFRDVRGWTGLHWAASCGRERTVVALFSLGAAPGALTDPTPEFPHGRTPADLASSNGHKGIAGFLAESSLTRHLSLLTLEEPGTSDVTEMPTVEAVEDVARTAMQTYDGNMQAGLTAVRNAAQAAARIHQVFRIQSFHRKKLTEYGDDKFGMSDEQALSLISVKAKANKAGQYDEPVAAAIRIQNKFRGWKGRKEFLIIRQRIVKIQAHVRGHLVRKHYRKVVWSVGIVEKAILRWRRKGRGLKGFRSERLIEGIGMRDQTTEEDDYDFLKEGRKQTEERLEKALARVKSMVQYPEARDQYRRLLTVVEEFQGSKEVLERVLNDSGEREGDMMSDIDDLLGEDALMRIS